VAMAGLQALGPLPWGKPPAVPRLLSLFTNRCFDSLSSSEIFLSLCDKRTLPFLEPPINWQYLRNYKVKSSFILPVHSYRWQIFDSRINVPAHLKCTLCFLILLSGCFSFYLWKVENIRLHCFCSLHFCSKHLKIYIANKCQFSASMP
jgi:hypothetical protein